MALQFDSGAYGRAFQQGEENRLANENQPLETMQMLGQAVGNYQKGVDQRQKNEREKQLYELKLAEAMRQKKAEQEMDTPYSQLLSSNQLSGEVAPQSLLDKYQAPMGQGEAAMPQQPRRSLIEEFRSGSWKNRLNQPPQVDMSSQALAQPDWSAYGLTPEMARLTPRQLDTVGKYKKLFAQPGLGDYDQQRQDLDLQIRRERLNQMRGGQTSGTQKAPTGYRYTQTGDLEPIPGGPATQKDTATDEKLNSTYELYKTAREGLVSGLQGSITGPVMGRIPAVTTNQQIAEGSVAAMAPVLKQLFRVAGEGVFTDRDQALLMQMLPTRTDSKEAAIAKINNIDAIVKAKLGIKDADGTGATPGQSNQPIIQRNKKTGQTRISYDGGQTWQIQ